MNTNNNDLIAEFMKEKLSFGCKKSSCKCSPILGAKKGCENSFSYYSNNYNDSWGWLMPVVKKITDTHDQSTYFLVGHIYEDIKHSLYDADLKELYNNVVLFINEYNKKDNTCFNEYKK